MKPIENILVLVLGLFVALSLAFYMNFNKKAKYKESRIVEYEFLQNVLNTCEYRKNCIEKIFQQVGSFEENEIIVYIDSLKNFDYFTEKNYNFKMASIYGYHFQFNPDSTIKWAGFYKP